MIGTILTQYQKVMDQIDTLKRLGTKLTFSPKVKDQMCNLNFFFFFFLGEKNTHMHTRNNNGILIQRQTIYLINLFENR